MIITCLYFLFSEYHSHSSAVFLRLCLFKELLFLQPPQKTRYQEVSCLNLTDCSELQFPDKDCSFTLDIKFRHERQLKRFDLIIKIVVSIPVNYTFCAYIVVQSPSN